MKSFTKNSVYPWVVVGLLWVVALLNYMDRQILSTMQHSMSYSIVELESAANFGRLMAIFLWVYGLMSPLAGIIADRISRKNLIIGSLFVWSFVTLMMGFCTSFSQVYCLRALMGVSEALYIPAGLALIADYHNGKTRSLAIGIHMTGLYAGQALGGFGASISASFSWQTAFFVFGGVGVFYSIILMLFLKENVNHKLSENVNGNDAVNKPDMSVKPVKSVREILSGVVGSMSMLLGSVSFWVILMLFATPSVPGWATRFWLPTLFTENLSIDMTKAGPLATILIAGASFVGVILGGILSDRWVLKNLRGRIYTSAIGLSLMVPALLLLGFGNNLPMIVGGGLCFGVGYGMFDANNMPILCQFFSSKYRATAYGIMNMTGVFAGAAITQVLGKSVEAGNLGHDFAMLSAVVVFALVLMLSCLFPKTVDMNEGRSVYC